MPFHAAPVLGLRPGDEEKIEEILRSRTVDAGLAQRARIVSLAAGGTPNYQIADMVGCSLNTVKAWRSRYEASGLAGLDDKAKPGRPRRLDRSKVIAATLTPPPKSYGISHWSSRTLGKKLGVSNYTVATIWADYGIQPWRAGTFKFSTDPQLEAKVVDVVGLYLDPPDDAIVLSVDEKSQIQALDRTAPMLHLQPGKIARGTPDYTRHGTTTLFAALNTATGQVTTTCKPRHTSRDFVVFLNQVARAHPSGDLHLIMDNLSTHKAPPVAAWLADNPRVTIHFTPTHASWLNMVEIFFGIVQRQTLKRGVFNSVRQLTDTLRRFVDHYNQNCQPFTWTKTAPQIIDTINLAKTSLTKH